MTSPLPRSLAQQWASKYINQLLPDGDSTAEIPLNRNLERQSTRARVAQKLLQSLRPASFEAWGKTEALLQQELVRHQINPKLINPWQITQDCYFIYEKALEFYAEQGFYTRLSAVIAPEVNNIRQKYTAVDPRVMGFVSLQFYYTGTLLEAQLTPIERTFFQDCFKVIDDHLYMPLQRAYAAAAERPYDDSVLKIIQQLVPVSSEIAQQIVQRVLNLYGQLSTYSGLLSDAKVQVSSVRDVEMFQVYLWVSVLEQSLAAIKEELFPLCLMLYPPLGVHWELVRQMLYLLGQQLENRLGGDGLRVFIPYLGALRDMFAPEVFAKT